MQHNTATGESAELPQFEDPETPEGPSDGSEAANSVAQHIQQCRMEMKEFQALLMQTGYQPLRIKELAASLNRHLGTLETDIADIRRRAAATDILPPAETALPRLPPGLQAGLQPGLLPEARFEFSDAPFRAPYDSLPRIRGLWPTLTGISATIACIAVFWIVMIRVQSDAPRMNRHKAHDTSSGSVAIPIAPRELPPLPPTTVSPATIVDGFSRGSEELYAALGRFPGQTLKNVLTHVHDENAAKGINVCSFEWHDGMPSLLFGDDKDQVKLDAILRRCAEAVDSY